MAHNIAGSGSGKIKIRTSCQNWGLKINSALWKAFWTKKWLRSSAAPLTAWSLQSLASGLMRHCQVVPFTNTCQCNSFVGSTADKGKSSSPSSVLQESHWERMLAIEVLGLCRELLRHAFWEGMGLREIGWGVGGRGERGRCMRLAWWNIRCETIDLCLRDWCGANTWTLMWELVQEVSA